MTYQIEDFWKNGFAGPFSLNKEEAALQEAADTVKEIIDNKIEHPIYKRYAVRDWHLEKPCLMDLFKDEELIANLNHILGKDVVLWRSKFFNKPPKSGGIDWHQEWGAFNGEEIGNDVPALAHKGDGTELWDVTVWIALADTTMDMSPVRFAKGTHRKRFPIDMVPLVESGFFVDPFFELKSKEELIERALSNSLIEDINTSKAFTEADINNPDLTFDKAKAIAYEHIKGIKGAITRGFYENEYEIVCQEVKKGDYWIFSERTMHGSGPNASDKTRPALNARITNADTLIYPGRLNGEYVDGSNLDISKHECVLLSGVNREPRNVYRTAAALV